MIAAQQSVQLRRNVLPSASNSTVRARWGSFREPG